MMATDQAFARPTDRRLLRVIYESAANHRSRMLRLAIGLVALDAVGAALLVMVTG